MTSSEAGTAEKSPLINATMIVSIAYNLFYWIAPLSKPLNAIKDNLAQQWGLLTFLEFLAMASLVVDLTVRWDKFTQTEQRWRMAITFLIGASFFVRLVFGIIGLYIIGEAH
jgi:cyanate permease